MDDPTPAERSIAEAHVADSADRSATLWLRGVFYWTLGVAMGAGGAFLAVTGAWLQAVLALAAGGLCVRRALAARREGNRVFAVAVQTLEDQRRS